MDAALEQLARQYPHLDQSLESLAVETYKKGSILMTASEQEQQGQYYQTLLSESRNEISDWMFVQDTGKTFQIHGSYDSEPAVAFEIQPGVFVIFDSEKHVLGGFRSDCYENTAYAEVSLEPIRDVLQKEGTVIPKDLDDDALDSALRWIEDAIDPQIPDPEKFSSVSSAKEMPLEYWLHLEKLCREMPEQREQISAFVQLHASKGLIGLWGVDTREEFEALEHIVKEDGDNIDFVLDFFSGNAQARSVYESRMGLTDQMRGVLSYLRIKERSMTKAIIHKWGSEDFSWEHVSFGIGGLRDVMFDALRFVKEPEDGAEEVVYYSPGFTELILNNAHDKDVLALTAPVVEYRWMQQVRLTHKGEFQKAAEFFYDALKPSLNEQADSSTGDTKQELDRIEGITRWLLQQNMIPRDGSFRYGDFGSGNGLRLLLPYIHWLHSEGIQTNAVVAVDLLDQPVAPNGEWKTMQADLSNPDTILSEKDGKALTFHMITAMWSVLTDQDLNGQIDMFEVIARHLEDDGIVVFDVPSFENYREEVVAYHAKHPDEQFGIFEREFEIEKGKKIKKKFFVPLIENLPYLLYSSGLLIVSEMKPGEEPVIPGVAREWVTKMGQKRMTVVARKMSEQDFEKVTLFGSSRVLSHVQVS